MIDPSKKHLRVFLEKVQRTTSCSILSNSSIISGFTKDNKRKLGITYHILFVMGIDFSTLNRSLSTFSDGNAKDGPKYTISSTYHSTGSKRELWIVGLIIGGSKNAGKSSLFRYIQAEGNEIPPKRPDVIVSTRVMWTNPFTGERSLV